ncbi:sigma-54 interaction domain-containing protein [Paratissierella segnis]|uniref:Sigma 54-interacting transcriptional regulator n=1 Tax=Paratissierella segnis TaxID=2763679 RepID=A0A926EST1_9FIRM|nr:sigma 54-interacting transcriptional regulator [Paratissierella segnis]MBC8587001.1 sigma 54-interacting transcriptional regulator [Paratissierella segnis]
MQEVNIDSILMQNILHYGYSGVHAIDANGRTIVYNKKMGELEGLKIDQVMDRDIFDIFPSLNERTSTLVKVANSGEPIINNIQTYLNYKGKSITTMSSTLPLKHNEKIIGAVELAQNITTIMDLSERLIKIQKESGIKGDTNTKNKIRRYHFDDIIGDSDGFKSAKRIAERAGDSSSSVLIYGETGTGKELFAQSIHYSGIRGNKPFIAQSCAAIPESLLESLLFGTAKGGFTGAVEREGLFEQANGGTLLFDELNSMSLSLQAKLLRVLQEGYIRRVGGTKDIPIDVRIIATTNEDPNDCIRQGTMRKDLYYRLSVINVFIPPLRERINDIEMLCNYFIKKYNKVLNKNIESISGDVINKFKEYAWPGNVRELENFIESAMNFASFDDVILTEDYFVSSKFISTDRLYPLNLDYQLDEKSLPEILDNIENELIKNTLEKYNYNITKTSKHLGIKRQTLQHKLKKSNRLQ